MIKLVKDFDKKILESIGVVTPKSMAICYNDILVGMIEYKVTDECIKIMYIAINDKYKRRGIAGKTIDMLKERYKGKFMYGDALPGALKFWESMGAEFDEDPEEDYLIPFHIEC